MDGLTNRLCGRFPTARSAAREKILEIGIGVWRIALNGGDELLSFRIIRTAVDHGRYFPLLT